MQIGEAAKKYLPDDFENYSDSAQRELVLVAVGKAKVPASRDQIIANRCLCDLLTFEIAYKQALAGGEE